MATLPAPSESTGTDDPATDAIQSDHDTDPLHRTNALVTGAASGIGRATASAWPPRGAVMAVDVNGDLLDELAAGRGLGGSITTLVGDVSTEDGVIALVNTAVDRLGTLDVVVNVAGVLSFSTPTRSATGRVEPV